MAVKRKKPQFSVAVMRERTDKQAVVQDSLEDISHLDCSRLVSPYLCHQTLVLHLNDQPGTEASSEECDFQPEASVFWSVLCTSVLSCSTWVPSVMATEDG